MTSLGLPTWVADLLVRKLVQPLLLGLALVVFLETPLYGQEPVREKVQLDEDFWESTPRRQAAAVAQMVGVGHPLSLAVMRVRGWELKVWNELEFPTEAGALPLNEDWFEVKDDEGRPLPKIAGKAPDEIPIPQKNLYNLYNQALVYSFRTPREAFAHSAKDNLYVKFAHIYNEPWKYRGKVIHLEGRLRRLRLLDATIPAQLEGVKQLCEGWVFMETYGTNPVVIIFPTLNPAELPIGENIDRLVSFDGYFILKYKYAAKDKERKTLLFIGPTLTLKPALQPEAGQSVSLPFLYGIVAFVALVSFGLLGLSWWFRQGDLQVRARIAQLQTDRVLQQLEEGANALGGSETPPPGESGSPPGREH